MKRIRLLRIRRGDLLRLTIVLRLAIVHRLVSPLRTTSIPNDPLQTLVVYWREKGYGAESVQHPLLQAGSLFSMSPLNLEMLWQRFTACFCFIFPRPTLLSKNYHVHRKGCPKPWYFEVLAP